MSRTILFLFRPWVNVSVFCGLLCGIAVASICNVALSSSAEAQKSKDSKEEKEEELPQSGVLSRSLSGGTGDAKVSIPWGKQTNPEGTEAPISGSVSRHSPKEWVMRVTNSSEDTYSVNLRVVQYDLKGTQVKADSFSYRLKGGEQAERTLTAAMNSVDAQLRLENWKNLTPKKDEGKKDGATADSSTADSSTAKGQGK